MVQSVHREPSGRVRFLVALAAEQMVRRHVAEAFKLKASADAQPEQILLSSSSQTPPPSGNQMDFDKTIARLEREMEGETSATSRLASDEFRGSSAVKKRGSKTRIVARPCFGPGRCENVLCEHSRIVPFVPSPGSVERMEMVVSVVRDRCEKEGYHVSKRFAEQWALANDLKIVGTLAAIKTNIDNRERFYRESGRTNWAQVNVLADERPQNKHGANEYRDERIKYLEDDDIGLKDILENNWNSAYGNDIKEQFAGDKLKQKKQYKMYRAEAHYRRQRAIYYKALEQAKTHDAEQIQQLLENYDVINMPIYDLDDFPDDKEVTNTSQDPSTKTEPAVETTPEVEPPLEMGYWTKLYYESKAEFDALEAIEAEEEDKPTEITDESADEDEESDGDDDSSEAHASDEEQELRSNEPEESDGDDDSSEAHASDEEQEPRSNEPEDYPVGEGVCDEEEELPANVPGEKIPNPSKKQPTRADISMGELESMSKDEELFQFLIRPKGREIWYQKMNDQRLSLADRVNVLEFCLMKYDSRLDDKSRRALKLQILLYRSHEERIQRKDYKLDPLPLMSGHQVAQFDTRGDEEAEENLAHKEEAASASRRFTDKSSDASSDKRADAPSDKSSDAPSDKSSDAPSDEPSKLPGGFMNLGFEEEELGKVIDKVVLMTDLSAEYRERAINGITQELISDLPSIIDAERTEEEQAQDSARLEEYHAMREKFKKLFGVKKPEADQADELDDTAEVEEQDDEPELSEKARGKRPIRLWEQQAVKDTPVTNKPVNVKPKKHFESLFKKMSKNAIESKLESMQPNDEDAIANLTKLRHASASLISDLGVDITDHDENDNTFNATHDPDAEEANVDAFFADDTTDMDDLQTPFDETTESTAGEDVTTSTEELSGATMPEPGPTIKREPPTEEELALQEIEVQIDILVHRLPIYERAFFQRIMKFHNLTGYKLYHGQYHTEDVGLVLQYIHDTPAAGMTIELICKLLTLCNNDPIRVCSFLNILVEEITAFFKEMDVQNATWKMYEDLIVRWDAWYWHCLITMKNIMADHGIDCPLV